VGGGGIVSKRHLETERGKQEMQKKSREQKRETLRTSRNTGSHMRFVFAEHYALKSVRIHRALRSRKRSYSQNTML
jgi:hypothetical protein